MGGSVPAASGQSGGKSPESVTRDAEVKRLMRWDGYEARQTCSQFCISSISALWSDVNRKPVKRGADWCDLDQTSLFEIRLELQRSDPFETVRPRKIKRCNDPGSGSCFVSVSSRANEKHLRFIWPIVGHQERRIRLIWREQDGKDRCYVDSLIVSVEVDMCFITVGDWMTMSSRYLFQHQNGQMGSTQRWHSIF